MQEPKGVRYSAESIIASSYYTTLKICSASKCFISGHSDF